MATLGWVLTQSRDACLQPSYAQASSRRLRLWAGNLKAPGVSSSHRPHSHGTRRPPGSGGICRGLPLNVVRIAPLHDAGITMRHGEICTLGRSYRLMHAEELRAGHVRSPGFPSLRTHHAYTFCSTLSSRLAPFALSEVEGLPFLVRRKDSASTSSARTGLGCGVEGLDCFVPRLSPGSSQ